MKARRAASAPPAEAAAATECAARLRIVASLAAVVAAAAPSVRARRGQGRGQGRVLHRAGQRRRRCTCSTRRSALNVDAHRDFSLNFGYEADVVTGATPRTYGAAVDAVSSATHFSDTRHVFHGGAELRLGPAAVDAGYTYAFENDYRSHAVDVGAKVDLWGKNTTFRLGYAHNFDSVCDVDNKGAHADRAPLARLVQGLLHGHGRHHRGAARHRQLRAVVDAGADADPARRSVGRPSRCSTAFSRIPYRRVRLFGTVEAQESEPLLRQRVAVQARFRLALPRAKRRHRRARPLLLRHLGHQVGHRRDLVGRVDPAAVPASACAAASISRGAPSSIATPARRSATRPSAPSGSSSPATASCRRSATTSSASRWRGCKNADEHGKVWRLFEQLDLNAKVDLIDYQPLTPLPPNQPRNVGLVNAIIAELGLALRW